MCVISSISTRAGCRLLHTQIGVLLNFSVLTAYNLSYSMMPSRYVAADAVLVTLVAAHEQCRH